MFSDELVSGAKFIRDDKAPPMASASPLPGDSWLSAEYHQKDLDQCKAEIKALQESAANEISAMCNPEPLEACTGRLQALQQEKDAGHCAVEQLRLCMEELVMLKGNVQDLHLNMSAISGSAPHALAWLGSTQIQLFLCRFVVSAHRPRRYCWLALSRGGCRDRDNFGTDLHKIMTSASEVMQSAHFWPRVEFLTSSI